MSLINKPRIYNKKTDDVPDDAVLIDRTTPWGNPYKIGVDGDFEQVKKLYINYLLANPALIADIRQSLKGRDLACWCVPEPCHAALILKLANDTDFNLDDLKTG
jgi:hypothetical protein